MKTCCEKYLAEQFGNDPDLIAEIYGEYVTSIKDKTAELAKAIDAADWQAADKAAHTIKGNALAAGDEDMAFLAIEARKATALGDADQSRSLLAKMEELGKGL